MYKKTYNKIVINCLKVDDCPMSDGDIWCIMEDRLVCPYLQLGVQKQWRQNMELQELTIKKIKPEVKAAFKTVQIMHGFSTQAETMDYIMKVYNEKKE